jgi:hypothetical protein
MVFRKASPLPAGSLSRLDIIHRVGDVDLMVALATDRHSQVVSSKGLEGGGFAAADNNRLALAG